MQKQVHSQSGQTRQKAKIGAYYSHPEYPNPAKLLHTEYNLELLNFTQQLTISQTYQSPSQPSQLHYRLPVPLGPLAPLAPLSPFSPHSSLYQFSVQFITDQGENCTNGNRRVEAVVAGRAQAMGMYQEGMRKGTETVMAGMGDGNAGEGLWIRIGRVEGKGLFVVRYCIVGVVEVTQDGFYRVQIPSHIFPTHPTTTTTTTFKLSLTTTHPLTKYTSPSHPLTPLSLSPNHILLALQSPQIASTNFLFLYSTQKFHQPSFVLGRCERLGLWSMVGMVPGGGCDDAERQERGRVKGEFVFLLDCSYSMHGSKIQMAKQALYLFIKSLPQTSYLNILPFGTTHTKLLPKSQPTTPETTTHILQQLHHLTANMGGTQIYCPLQQALQQPVIEGYARQIFLLTDGEVSNPGAVIGLVEGRRGGCRVYTVGVGGGACRGLVEGCARVGMGGYTYIQDNQHPQQKIITLLSQSLTPPLPKLSLTLPSHYPLHQILQQPASPTRTLQTLTLFYITFNQDFSPKKQELQLELRQEYQEGGGGGKVWKHGVGLGGEDGELEGLGWVDKIVRAAVLRDLEKKGEQKELQLSYKRNVIQYYNSQVNKANKFKQQAIQYSITHQILSKHTAWIYQSSTPNNKHSPQQIPQPVPHKPSPPPQPLSPPHSKTAFHTLHQLSTQATQIRTTIQHQYQKYFNTLQQCLDKIKNLTLKDMQFIANLKRAPQAIQTMFQCLHILFVNTQQKQVNFMQTRFILLPNCNTSRIIQLLTISNVGDLPQQKINQIKKIIRYGDSNELKEKRRQELGKFGVAVQVLAEIVGVVVEVWQGVRVVQPDKYKLQIIHKQLQQIHKKVHQLEQTQKQTCNNPTQPTPIPPSHKKIRQLIRQQHPNGSWDHVDLPQFEKQEVGAMLGRIRDMGEGEGEGKGKGKGEGEGKGQEEGKGAVVYGQAVCRWVCTKFVKERIQGIIRLEGYTGKQYKLILNKSNEWLNKESSKIPNHIQQQFKQTQKQK